MLTLEQQKEEFECKCYEAYKLDWMLSHGATLSEIYKIMTEIAAEVIDDELMEVPKTTDETRTLISHTNEVAKDSLLNDVGFKGSMWACKDEFLETEFTDAEYMRSLFSRMLDHYSMLKFYEDNYVQEETSATKEPYWVTMKIDGRFIAKVFANDYEEARTLAKDKYEVADCGEITDISGECIIVEDKDGCIVWEK